MQGQATRDPTASSKRAIAYLRVSTSLQKEEGYGLEAQRECCRAFAKAKGLELLGLVVEAASGGIQNGEEFSWEHRPVLLLLVERAQAGEFDVLLVARLDRLSRDHASLVVLERRLQRHGVEVVSCAEENGDSAMAQFVRGQLALVAELDSSLIRDRLEAGKAQAKKQGRHVHGRPPYGYRSSKGMLAPIPELVPVVRKIFEDAAGGYSASQIAKRLNSAGVAPAQRAKAWTRQAVRVILTNPAYRGERHGVKRAHPAIVGAKLWSAAQR